MLLSNSPLLRDGIVQDSYSTWDPLKTSPSKTVLHSAVSTWDTCTPRITSNLLRMNQSAESGTPTLVPFSFQKNKTVVRMDKEDVVHTCDGILRSHQKE